MPASTEGVWLGVAKAPGDRATLGDDDGVYAVHAALLRTGRVILWAGGLESSTILLFRSWTWDPSTFVAGSALTGVEGRWFLPEFDPGGAKASPPGPVPDYDDHPDVDLFCAFHVTLEDGRLLALGGTKKPPFSKGNRAVFTYDPGAERWQPHSPGMVKGRWYPTTVVLQDGRVAIFSGRPNSGIEDTAEIVDSENLKPEIISGGDKRMYIYPGLIMVPGGAVYFVPTAWQYEGASTVNQVKTALGPTSSFRLTGTKSGAWTDHTDPIDPSKPLYPANFLREEGTFVLLPPAQDGRILVIGGGFATNPNDGTSASQQSSQMDECEVLHTRGGAPRWTPAGKMRRQRSNVHAVVLPDGKVLILGGHDGAKRVHTNDQLVPEMFDPSVPYDPADPHAAFTDMAAMGASRLYHAGALLLPDGRVLAVGGEDQDHTYPQKHGSNHHSIEIYEPPYCHQGTRPEITGHAGVDGPDDELSYGGALDITSPEAGSIASVVLMRLGSTTHHTDTEQRHVPLSFYRSGTTLRAVAVNDPSVAPPGYYMLFIVDDQGRPCKEASIIRLSRRRCTLVTDRSTYSIDELNTTGTSTFPNALYVHVDGFLPSELGVTTATPSPGQLTSWAPAVTFNDGGTTLTQIRAVPVAIHPEDPALPAGRRQRLTFEYSVEITSSSIFPPAGQDVRSLAVQATTSVPVHGTTKRWRCGGEVRLTRQANPYMLDGPTHWLSIDVRVFKVRNGADPFSITTPVTNPTGYIQELINDWNGLPTAGHPFQSISEAQADSALQLASTEGGQPVYNFAVARVRYRGQTLTADDVRVFFRMFSTAATNLSYDSGATYRRHARASGQTVPLLGIRGSEVASIPFFAVPRIDTTTSSMEAQPEDTPNKQQFAPTGGGEASNYFGAWLDINQGVGRFPRNPGMANGAFSPTSVESIRDLINGRHQCLAAELFFAADPVSPGDTPANNDNLSQRNLAIEGSDNPGGPDGHTIALTFDVVPTWNLRDALKLRFVAEQHQERRVAVRAPGLRAVAGIEATGDHRELVLDTGGTRAALLDRAPDPLQLWAAPTIAFRPVHHEHAAEPYLRWLEPDELMIDWGGLPSGAEATLFMPGVRADDILELQRLRWAEHRYSKIDEETVSLPVGGMTHVPLPAFVEDPLEALLTIQLPETVRSGQSFVVQVHQVSSSQRQVVGTFELRVPVRSGPQLVQSEVRWLAVLRDMLLRRQPTDRWTPVLTRLAGIVENRVRAFGIDPDTIPPSAEGHDLEPVCPPDPADDEPADDEPPEDQHPEGCRCAGCRPAPKPVKRDWVTLAAIWLILVALIVIIVILLV